jgi:hypothetical protein
MPAPDVLKFFSVLTEAYKENQTTQLELAKLQAQKEIALLEIKNKYELYHKVFDNIFDERKLAIWKAERSSKYKNVAHDIKAAPPE